MNTNPHRISDLLQDCLQSITRETISLGEFIDTMHERGFGMLIFLFALPMAIPLPVPPGVNILFAAPLLFLTFQLIYGAQRPWLPQKLRKKEFNKGGFEKTIHQAAPWLDRLSYIIKPRMGFITHGIMPNIVGAFGFLFALCICIPIPMTNTVPSLAVLLMAVGLLMRDGLAILGGIIIGTVWIALLSTLGITGLKAILNYIF